MTSRNKFGFSPISDDDVKPRKRDVGPMGAAVREAASSLNESTESLVEQRRKNASDAREFRQAQMEGRVLVALPLDDIGVNDLPRDRFDLDAVAGSSEMDELKASIRERGQKEPIEVYGTAAEGYQLKKGWRRLTALRQLLEETGDSSFATVVARVADGQGPRIDLYIDMVEENVIREDLSFAEMAQVALTAAEDDRMSEGDAEALVGRLYASLHKMKRSYIRSFVQLLRMLGDALVEPKSISRNLGVDVVRLLNDASTDTRMALRAKLERASTGVEQIAVLQEFVAGKGQGEREEKSRSERKSLKYEFHVGSSKVTARDGECRILSNMDFASVDRTKLLRAIEAFDAVLKGE